MEKLTEHQEEALNRFPADGWHRVDHLGFGDKSIEDYCFRTRRPEYTAEILEKKGYLESRVLRPEGTASVWALFREYRRIQN